MLTLVCAWVNPVAASNSRPWERGCKSNQRFLKHLELHGFWLESVKGSHHKMKNKEGKIIVVPVHGKKELGKGLEYLILKQAGLK
ncbi:MAG: type II toxin-antitoxin system HicA family toxin [Spirochaetes bacterium]|nr:type II toxin-antitoxin system HicA family toxin [Spirochaetota bacterium]